MKNSRSTFCDFHMKEKSLESRSVVKLKNEGLPGVLVNKGTLAKYRREQGNINQFLGTGNKISKNYSTKTF